MSQQISPLNLERYELKYLIPLRLVEPISRFVETYCQMDYYSEMAQDNYYTINSLYLDSPSLYLFRYKETADAFSFNMRVRSYGTGEQPPYFFEIKYKIREFVRKHRTLVADLNWSSILENEVIPDGLTSESKKNLEDFLRVKITYNVAPVILTQYRRKAYISREDSYARVTFDRDLRYQEMKDWQVAPDECLLTHYDHPYIFELPEQNVVLELKCEKKIPTWMIDMIKKFQLVRSSFSKYGNSMITYCQIPEVVAPGILY
ncbi:MAG: polyphosphate polymerase domain-containing protein, partial [Bdellovibrio sp.]